jgi:hypothetical protein
LALSPAEIDEPVTEQLIERAHATMARSPEPEQSGARDHWQGCRRDLPAIDAAPRVGPCKLPAELVETVSDRLALHADRIG